MTTAAETKSVKDYCIEDTTDGKYLVIAGPGTGKTYTVTHKIKHMIENEGIIPEEILCLTFSDTAAKEMRQNIGEEYDVNVYTYHSFCKSIMDEFKDEFDFEELNVIGDDDKRALIAQCVDEIQTQAYNNEKNQRYKFIKNILDGIDEIKKARLTKEQFFYNLDNNPAWRPRIAELKIKEQEEIELEQEKRKNQIDSNYEKLEKLYNSKKALTQEQMNIIKFRENKDEDLRNNKLKIDATKKLEALEKRISQMEELWSLYELYQSKMKQLNFIDFNDMINLVLDKFKDNESSLLYEVNQKYKYLIVDEYQDTNNPQNEIIFELAKNTDNIFVVGDDDQIIYTFQGASVDTLSKFNETFLPVKKCFEYSMRSSKPILDVSRYLAELQDDNFYKFMSEKTTLDKIMKDRYAEKSEHNESIKLRFLSNYPIKDSDGNDLEKVLSPDKNSAMYGVEDPVTFFQFEKKDGERDYIVNSIIKLKKEIDEYNKNLPEGKSPKRYSDIAILTYRNKMLNDYEAYLKANGVPVEITGGKNIFKIPAVNLLVTYMQFLTNPELYSDKLLSYLLLNPFHIDAVDYMNICRFKTHHKTLLENIKECEKTAVNKKKLQDFLKTYEYLRKFIVGEDYTTSLLEILKQTGIYEYYFKKNDINKYENMKGIKKLIELADTFFEVNKGSTFVMFVNYLNKLYDDDTEIKLDKEDKPRNAVQLSTYHASKGRGFEYVFMPSLNSGDWDKLSTQEINIIPTTVEKGITYEDMLDKQYRICYLDSIKLLYVGMTRTKRRLMLSYNTEDGKLSWFIKKLREKAEQVNKARTEKGEEPIFVEPKKEEFDFDLCSPEYGYDFDEKFKSEVEPAIPNKFSVSALNCYRKCPQQYFYNYILNMKVKSENVDDINYGNIIHNIFQDTIEYAMEHHEYPDIKDMHKKFDEEVANFVLSNPDDTKASAAEKVFDEENGYYNKFIKLADAEILEDKEKAKKEKPELTSERTGKRTMYAEYKFHHELEMPDDWKTSLDDKDSKIILEGSIDRLDKDVDGKYIIYDYKTPVACDDIGPTNNYFYQVCFYKDVLEKQFGKKIEVKEVYFLLPLEQNGNHQIQVHKKFVDYQSSGKVKGIFGEKIQELHETIGKIRKMDFTIKKKPNSNTCNRCAYKRFCESRTIDFGGGK